MSGDIMHPPSPVSPAVMVESSHSRHFTPQRKTTLQTSSNRIQADSPAMWGAPQLDTFTRGSPRPNSSLSGSSASQQSPLLPPPSPSSRRGEAASAGRGIDALLLSSGDPAPGAHPSSSAADSTSSPTLRRRSSPVSQLHHVNPSQSPPSPKPPLAPLSSHPSNICAAAAELADRVSAHKDAAAPSSSSLSPAHVSIVFRPRLVTPQPSASMAQQDGNDLALKMTVVAGPGTDTTYITARDTRQVVIGRLPSNTLTVDDPEVSGTHLILRWLEPEDGGPPCWQVADAGSLNGTMLNGTRISVAGRKRSAAYRLNSDDLLQLGTSTAIKVLYVPRELLEQQARGPPGLRTLSGVNAPPPPIKRTASRDGLHRAPASISTSEPPPPAQVACEIAVPEMGISGYAVSKVGQEHLRRSQVCEDVIRWVPEVLPRPALQTLAMLGQSGGGGGRSRALLRTITKEAVHSPALLQFMASFGGASANSSGSSIVSTGTVPAGSPSGTQRGQPGMSTVLSPAIDVAQPGGAFPPVRQTPLLRYSGSPLPLRVTSEHTDEWSPVSGADSLLRSRAGTSATAQAPPGAFPSVNPVAATVPASSARQSLEDVMTHLGDTSRPRSFFKSSGSSSFGRHSFTEDGPADSAPLATAFCVLDGHCGRGAAQQASTLLPQELATRIDPRQLSQGHPPNAAVWGEAFLAADQGIECEDGCTATVALAWRDDSNGVCLQAANVGDSAAIFITTPPGGPPQVTHLTTDHRWTTPEERTRLALMGIQLEGRTRLYGLNLSRCLGDKFLKDEDLGLSCQPSVSEVVRLPCGDRSGGGVLVLATDGLWDVTDTSTVVQVALRALPDGPQAAAEALLQLALTQHSRDDVSVLLLHVKP